MKTIITIDRHVSRVGDRATVIFTGNDQRHDDRIDEKTNDDQRGRPMPLEIEEMFQDLFQSECSIEEKSREKFDDRSITLLANENDRTNKEWTAETEE